MLKFLKSSIGKKVVMASTGCFLVVFLIAHLLGNLEVFGGPDAINAYGAFLRSVPKLLWGLRIAVIVAFVLHIVTSIQLSLEQKAARPVKYINKKTIKATIASRTMLLGGLVVLSFLVYHLAHLTLGVTHPEHAALLDDKGRHDIYSMMILGFSDIRISAFYVLAQVFLAFHVSHGFVSAAQTLGLSNQKLAKGVRLFGVGFAVVMCILYVSIPTAVVMGWLRA